MISLPIRPKPITPSFFCQSSVPLSFFFSHLSSFMELSATGTFLARANIRAKTISATDTDGASGVFITFTPCVLAASWSTLSRPTPARTISFRLSAAAMTSFVIFVALRITTQSNPLICSSIGPSFSLSLRTISRPASFIFCTADSANASAISIRAIIETSQFDDAPSQTIGILNLTTPTFS